MGIRGRFTRWEWRRGVTDRHKFISLLVALALVSCVAVYNHAQAREYQAKIELSYQRAFSDMAGYINNIDANLQKIQLVTTTRQISNLASEIWRQAASAKANLGQLPTYNMDIENTSKFLSQVGDFSYSLASKVLDDGKIEAAEQQSLADLSRYATNLNNSLQSLQNDIYMGTVRFSAFDNMVRKSATVASISKIDADVSIPALAEGEKNTQNKKERLNPDLGGSLADVEQEFLEYPTLIYDGPFSDHLERAEAEFLRDQELVTPEDAQKKAQEFLKAALNSEVKSVDLTESTNGGIETYSYTAKTNNADELININVTKKGGFVLWMLNSREVGQPYYKISDAIDKAQKVFASQGISGMKDNYYTVLDGVATINFIYTENDVKIYPDLVSVMVALDKCEVVGIQAKGYMMNHKNRTLNASGVDEQTAKKAINQNLVINSVKRAVIPTNGGREIYCYEFLGKTQNNKNFLIYVNCETGKEENILLLLQNDNGTLTI